MQVINSNWEIAPIVREWRRNAERIGFVPTMGNLHEGHLRLVRVAQHHSDRIVVSIYVNPMQFSENDDFNNYPRTMQKDLQKLEQLGVDLVFTPGDQSMYPQGVENSSFVEVPSWLANQLEGAHRPGHFRGVATVVAKLFNIVQPDLAVFGEKDFQQLMVVRRLVEDFNFPIEILGEATVREGDGLALSSRNQHLTKEERQRAAGLYATLSDIRERILLQNMTFTDLEQAAIMQLEKQGFSPDYVAIRNSEDLQEPENLTDSLVILAAARLGKTRLIDNLRV
ncbi:MAG: pantoate--beta-alanine ligase [Thioalkalispiraceae bacterium]|jgi:pantoate--beta-alanine ligase